MRKGSYSLEAPPGTERDFAKSGLEKECIRKPLCRGRERPRGIPKERGKHRENGRSEKRQSRGGERESERVDKQDRKVSR